MILFCKSSRFHGQLVAWSKLSAGQVPLFSLQRSSDRFSNNIKSDQAKAYQSGFLLDSWRHPWDLRSIVSAPATPYSSSRIRCWWSTVLREFSFFLSIGKNRNPQLLFSGSSTFCIKCDSSRPSSTGSVNSSSLRSTPTFSAIRSLLVGATRKDASGLF